MTRVSNILNAIHGLAPLKLQQSWDNCGLQIGDAAAHVDKILVSLDIRTAVIDEAVKMGAQCLVTHHPLFFKPFTNLTADNAVGAAALALARHGMALIAAHTNYDAAPGGLNDLLARAAGLQQCEPFEHPEHSRGMKLCVCMPPGDLQRVQQAIFEAGAGCIGEYCECSFRVSGTGSFRGSSTTKPTIGRPGEYEETQEIRLETVLPAARAEAVVRALRAAHSYEEAAFDLSPTEIVHERAGLGRVGNLPQPLTVSTIVTRLKKALRTPTVELIGRPPRTVRRLAVIAGGGGDFWTSARETGADLLITGEMKHHQRIACADAGMAVLLAGHYATERPAVLGLADLLRGALPRSVVIRPSRREDNPTVWL